MYKEKIMLQILTIGNTYGVLHNQSYKGMWARSEHYGAKTNYSVMGQMSAFEVSSNYLTGNNWPSN